MYILPFFMCYYFICRKKREKQDIRLQFYTVCIISTSLKKRRKIISKQKKVTVVIWNYFIICEDRHGNFLCCSCYASFVFCIK